MENILHRQRPVEMFQRNRTVSFGSVLDEEDQKPIFKTSSREKVKNTEAKQMSSRPALQLSEFFFQERFDTLDSRKLYRINIDEIIEQVDVGIIHEMIDNITFSQLEEKDLQNLPDVIFVNAFKVAQLAIEYLANLQGSLQSHIADQTEFTGSLEMRIEDLEIQNEDLKKEYSLLQRKLRHKEKLVQTYETLFAGKLPGADIQSALAGMAAKLTSDAHTCPTCEKVFSSRRYLWQHCKRRQHHFPKELMDEEKEDHSFIDAQRNHEYLVKETLVIKEMLEKAMLTRNDQAREAIREVQAKEHETYENKLRDYQEEALRERSRLLEEHRSTLNSTSLEYEKRIALLEGKVQTLESQLQEKDEVARSKISAIARELESSLEKSEKMRSEQQKNAYLSQPSKNETARRFALRQVLNTAKRFYKQRLGAAFETWKDSISDASPKDVLPSEEIDRIDSVKPKDVENVDDLDVDALVEQFVASRRLDTITEEQKTEMYSIDQRIEADIRESGIEIAKQRMQYIPDPRKPYLRCRWQHPLHEIRNQMKIIVQELREQVGEYGCEIVDDRLKSKQLTKAMKLLNQEFSEQPEDVLNAFQASKELIKQLTNAYYEGPISEKEWTPNTMDMESSSSTPTSGDRSESEYSTTQGKWGITNTTNNLVAFEELESGKSLPDQKPTNLETERKAWPSLESRPIDFLDAETMESNNQESEFEQSDFQNRNGSFQTTGYLERQHEELLAEEDEVEALRNEIREMGDSVKALRDDDKDPGFHSRRELEKVTKQKHYEDVRMLDAETEHMKMEIARKKREIQIEKEKLRVEKRKKLQDLEKAKKGKEKRMQRENTFLSKKEERRALERNRKLSQLETLRGEMRLLEKESGIQPNSSISGISSSPSSGTVRSNNESPPPSPPPLSPRPKQYSVSTQKPNNSSSISQSRSEFQLSPNRIETNALEKRDQDSPPPLSPRPQAYIRSQQRTNVSKGKQVEIPDKGHKAESRLDVNPLPRFVQTVKILSPQEFHGIEWDKPIDL